MSIKIMGQVWDLDLPAPKLLVLLAMTDHADHTGSNIYPSVELIAWKTGYSESQARRIIKALVKDGILSSQLRPGKTTLYAVHLEKGKLKEPFKRSNTGGQNDTPSTAMTPQGLHSYDTPGGSTAMTPEPSLEPLINHNHPAQKSAEKIPVEKKSRAPHKNAPWHDALLRCFKLNPQNVTRTADRTYWTAAADFASINFPIERIPEFHRWCINQNWPSFTVMAMAKHAGEWLVKNKVKNNIVKLDPALDLSIQQPVIPMMIARRKVIPNE